MQPAGDRRRRRGSWRARTLVTAVVATLALVAVACGDDETPDGGASEPPPVDTPEPDTPEPDTTGAPDGDDGDLEVPEGAELATEADDGTTVDLAVGELLVVRLDSAWAWEDPQVGDAGLEVTPVSHLVDPGFFEWQVTAHAPATDELRFAGTPNCADPDACPDRTVTLRIDAADAVE